MQVIRTIILLILTSSLFASHHLKNKQKGISNQLSLFLKSLDSFVPVMFSNICRNGFLFQNFKKNHTKKTKQIFLPLGTIHKQLQTNLDIFNPSPDVFFMNTTNNLYFKELSKMFESWNQFARHLQNRLGDRKLAKTKTNKVKMSKPVSYTHLTLPTICSV